MEIEMDKASFSAVEHVPTQEAAKVPLNGHVQGDVTLTDADGQIRLVPTPTSSPRDPLNFSLWRKAIMIFTLALFTTFSIGGVASFSALLNVFFGIYLGPPYFKSPTDVLRLVTLASFMVGVGNFVFVPIAIVWGRRPALLAGGLMFSASCVGAAKSTGYSSHLVSRIFMGIGAGAAEVLVPLSVVDMTYIHQRETYIAYVNVIQQIVTAALSIGSTYMAVDVSWQTYYFVLVALGFFAVASMFLFGLETRFDRPAAYIDGQLVAFDAYGNMKVVSNAEAKEMHQVHGTNTDERFKIWQKLNPFPAPVSNPVKAYISEWVSLGFALADPGVLWACGMRSIALAIIIVISLSLPTVVQRDYHWPAQNVGLINLSVALGPLFAIPYGMLADKVVVNRARKRDGKHSPEDRMFMMIFPIVVTGLCNVLYGYLAQKTNKPHWFVLLFLYAVVYFGFVTVAIGLISFTVEHASYHPGSSLILVLGGKNLLSYPISNASSPVVAQGRLLHLHGILTGVWYGWSLLAIALYFLLPRYRAWKAARNITT